MASLCIGGMDENKHEMRHSNFLRSCLVTCIALACVPEHWEFIEAALLELLCYFTDSNDGVRMGMLME
jgi:predicted protein tyrosine phosphatase